MAGDDSMREKYDNDKIHVGYALSDKNGTYSKYIGTSLCSLLENTKAKIIVHLFHDDSLSEENKRKFDMMIERYSAEIRYLNVRAVAKELCDKAQEIFAMAMQADARYPEAAMYRIMAPQLLPDVDRLIYLDADTIINLDIQKLWQESLNTSGIGVIGEYDLLSHYGKAKEKHTEDDLQEKILNHIPGASLKNAFNSGVLLMDLSILRRKGDLLLPGMHFLAKYPGESKFFDQDILNYHFATTAKRLPWYYNILIHWEKNYTERRLQKGIYHYMGHMLEMNPASPYDVLFYDYFIKTPWCDGKFLCSIYWTGENIIKNMISPILNDLHRMIHLLIAKKIVVATTDEKINVAMDLFENPNEINENVDAEASEEKEKKYTEKEIINICERKKITLLRLGEEAKGINLALPYDIDEYVYVFFVHDYKTIRTALQNAGLKEYEHFMNGVALTMGEKWLRVRMNQGLFFSVL